MTIHDSVIKIQQRIVETAQLYQRPIQDLKILAVSKGQSAAAIKEAYLAGISDFGENYYQEAQKKIIILKNLTLCWHFIGPIQSNKVQGIAHDFSWVHSVNREKIAELLAIHRPEHLPPLNLCLQVNLDNEVSKSGIPPKNLPQLAQFVSQLPNLRLRGLMAIPMPQQGEQQQYESLLRLTDLFHQLNTDLNVSMDTLSMGMSDDLVAAIRAGSTIVRIGRAIFGERGV